MEAYLSNLTVFNHPLIKHKVSHLCDVNTGTKEFSELVKELAMLMGYETLKELKTKDVEIQAPLQKIITPVLAEDFTIVPILRAGLGMVDGLRELSPTAKVGHIGLYRDEETLKPMTYYFKLPVDTADGPVVVVDPALATGGSADAAIQFLKDAGCKNIKFMCIFASEVGIKLLYEKHPEMKKYTAALNAFYTSHPALYEIDNSWAGFTWCNADDKDNSTLSFVRWSKKGKDIIAICNFRLI